MKLTVRSDPITIATMKKQPVYQLTMLDCATETWNTYLYMAISIDIGIFPPPPVTPR